MKILVVISLVIFAFGIKVLYDLNHEATYQQERHDFKPNQKCDKSELSLDYLFCFPLQGELDLLANRTEIDLEQLNEEFLNYFQSEKFESERRKRLEKNRGRFHWIFSAATTTNIIILPLKQGNYYLFNENICFAIQDQSLFAQVTHLDLFDKESYFVFKKDTYDLYKLNSPKDLVNVEIILNEEHPNLNCDKNYSRFQCLNECFKNGRRASRYFYDGNETGVIVLGQDKSVQEHEKLCFDQCADDCKANYFSFSTSQNEIRARKYTAQPIITDFEFWLQLTALLTSFVALSLVQCQPKSIDRTIFRKLLILICLVPVLILFFILYNDRSVDNQKEAIKKEISFKQLELDPLKLTVCVGVANILTNDYRKESNNFQDLKSFYQNKTFAQLERETDRVIEETVGEIYLKYLNKRKEVSWTISPRVLFLGYNNNALHRCFEIIVSPKEPLYQSLLSATRLVLNFKHTRYLVSLEPVNVSSNAENSDFDYRLEMNNRKWEKILSEEETCLDYGQVYANCDSKQNCLEVCLNKEMLNRFGKIAKFYMVYKDQLSEQEWSVTRINDTIHPYDISRKIRSWCEDKFKKNDCYSTRFKSKDSLKHLPYDLTKELVEKPLSFVSSALPLELLVIQGAFLALNLFRLLCVIGFLKFKVRKIELLHSIIYGICLIAFLAHLCYIFGRAMNEQLTYNEYYESPKSVRMPEAVMCFERLNITEHDSSEQDDAEEPTVAYNETDTSYNETVSDVVTHLNSTDFDNFESVMPKWSDNYQLAMNYGDELTGSRLEELTSDLTPEKIFDKIMYLDGSNQWISLDSINNFANNDLSVGQFFLQGKKCFSVRNKLDYDRNQFAVLQDQKIDVLNVLLNASFERELNQKANFLFSLGTKNRLKNEFNDFFDELTLRKYGYSINQRSLVKMTVKNLFSWLNPFAFHTESGQLDSYFSKLKDAFKERYNLTTLSLPLQEDSNQEFHLKISNDSLFEQFYDEYVETNGPPIDPQRPEMEFAVNEIRDEVGSRCCMDENEESCNCLRLSLTFAKKVIEQSNIGAYLKISLYLLNALIVLVIFGLFDRCFCKLSKRF